MKLESMRSLSAVQEIHEGHSRLSVLMDLRPAFDGLYGIAQESRLSFALMQEMKAIEVSGLIHHPALPLAQGLSQRPRSETETVSADEILQLSRLVARSLPRTGPLSGLRDFCALTMSLLAVHGRCVLDSPIPLHRFPPAEFDHFLWSRLFSQTLSSEEFRRCLEATYAVLSPPWNVMHAIELVPWLHRYAKVDTSGYDVLIAQTPWPGRTHDRTQLVVRFHDAVPIFMPHTLKQPRMGQRFQASALRANAVNALFACPSAASRSALLKVFPDVEDRALVVYDRVSRAYRPTRPDREHIREIVVSRASNARMALAARRYAKAQPGFPFFLMVGTLEPRKNHKGFIAAWETMCLSVGHSTPALVIVGSPGWQSSSITQTIKTDRYRSPICHLESVSTAELRDLYSAAEAVICPSFEEGFDLPSVEAMCCGAAVVASDIPIHRETLRDAALFFDPYSVEDMFDVLKRAVEQDVQLGLRANAAEQAVRFDDAIVRGQWETVFEACRVRKMTQRAMTAA